jgi:selenoprotein W-related protein
LTEKIAHDYKNAFSRLVLKPSSGGVFEVRVNGQDIFSRARNGGFPDEAALAAEVGTLLPSET